MLGGWQCLECPAGEVADLLTGIFQCCRLRHAGVEAGVGTAAAFLISGRGFWERQKIKVIANLYEMSNSWRCSIMLKPFHPLLKDVH